MRVLKFRTWDKEEEEYRNGYDVLLKYDGSAISRYALGALDTDMPINVIIEQYAGLTDKNGKEIYEGDIVEWVDGLWEKHIFEIIWNECRASFQMVEIGQEYPYILQGLSDKMKPYCEVIGNIHESNMEELCQKE